MGQVLPHSVYGVKREQASCYPDGRQEGGARSLYYQGTGWRLLYAGDGFKGRR